MGCFFEKRSLTRLQLAVGPLPIDIRAASAKRRGAGVGAVHGAPDPVLGVDDHKGVRLGVGEG